MLPVRKIKGILKIDQSITCRDIVWELRAPAHWLKLIFSIFSVILSQFQGFSWCGLFMTQFVSLVLCLSITSFLSNFVSFQLYLSTTLFLSNFVSLPLCFSPTSCLSLTLFLSPTSFLFHFVSLLLRSSPTSFLSKVDSRAASFFLTSGRVCHAQKGGCLCVRDWSEIGHFRPQRPRSFWSAPRIAILGADRKERGLWGREWRLANVHHNESFTFTGESHFNRFIYLFIYLLDFQQS